MSIKALQNQRGFSLIEAIIAMVILTIGLLAVGLMQIGAMKGNTTALTRADGVAMAQSVMDTLISSSLDNALLTDNGSVLDAGAATAGSPPVPGNADHAGGELFGANPVQGVNGMNYTVFWNVADDTPINDAKTVRLFVYWDDQRFGLNRVVSTTVVGGLY